LGAFGDFILTPPFGATLPEDTALKKPSLFGDFILTPLWVCPTKKMV